MEVTQLPPFQNNSILKLLKFKSKCTKKNYECFMKHFPKLTLTEDFTKLTPSKKLRKRLIA